MRTLRRQKAKVANLVAASEDELQEECSKRLRRYNVVHGFSQESVVHSVQTFRRVTCTTNVVEKVHGSGACLMKLHEQLQENLLAALTLLHSSRQIVMPSQLEKKISKLQLQLAAIRKKLCQGVTAFNMYVEENSDDIKAGLVAIGCNPLQVKQRWNNACSDAWKAVDHHGLISRRLFLPKRFQ